VARGDPTGSPLPSRKRNVFMLDVLYVLGAIALFVVVGLIGRAVEKL
jgi:hypothetical protein